MTLEDSLVRDFREATVHPEPHGLQAFLERVHCVVSLTHIGTDHMKGLVALVLTVLTLCGCGSSSNPPPPAGSAPSTDALPADGAFIGRVWISTKPGRPLGTMLVFLPNRSLIMDSCFETYRISEWGVMGDTIRWRENSIPIEASVSLPGPDELTLHIVGQEAQSYIAASVPYVCPEMPR